MEARKKLLEGSVTKSILSISLPIIFVNVLQTLYQLIDTFWVGRLGVDAVAAVSLSFPIIFFLTSLAMGFAMAGSIFIAQYNGKGDSENVSRVTGQTLAITALLALGISLIGYFLSPIALGWLTKDAAVLHQANIYLQVSFLAMVAVFIFIIFQSALRGVGEVKLPLYIVSFTLLLNFFLDPILMFGWKSIPSLGVAGVALATLITETLSALIGIAIFLRGKHGVRLYLRDLKISLTWVKRLFLLGLPSSLEMSSRSLAMVLMTFIVSTFGTLAVAAFGIGVKILSFVIIPAIGFAMATTTLVGNNLGARQKERSEAIVKRGMQIAFSTLSLLGILLFIFAPQIADFLVPNENELIAVASSFVRIMALTFGFIGVQTVVIGTFKGAGQTTTSMLLAMIHAFTLFFCGYLFSTIFGWQETGIWFAYPTANFIALLFAFYLYLRKDWLRKELV